MIQAGTVIAGRYTLEAEIGSGGMGRVWRASSESGAVAVKFLQTHAQWARKRFDVEAQALSRLHHPHCLALRDFGVLPDGSPYLVTDLLSGQELSEWMRGRSEVA